MVLCDVNFDVVLTNENIKDFVEFFKDNLTLFEEFAKFWEFNLNDIEQVKDLLKDVQETYSITS